MALTIEDYLLAEALGQQLTKLAASKNNWHKFFKLSSGKSNSIGFYTQNKQINLKNFVRQESC
jgi:hypothetical protein